MVDKLYRRTNEIKKSVEVTEDKVYDLWTNDDRVDEILHRMNEIKEIVDGTEGKVYDLWEKKDDTNA